MDTFRRAATVLAAAMTLGATGLRAQQPVPLLDNLGDHHYPITTLVPLAQRYFDQGLRLYYGFNHAEAIRAFREAQRLDPLCAMCFWGEAISYGPNINAAMDAESGRMAYEALQKAISVKQHASEREQALIDALAARYAADPPEDRAHLDRAYADAMGALARRWPDDIELGVLYAEALMDLRPWDYWTEEGERRPEMADAFAYLERAVERDPTHPGACHFYIHAVEKEQPELAVPCAERLASLMPGAGHLVHMPGHIYIRVGRYLDAVETNRHAVHADESYIQDLRPGVGRYTAGYYPHNYDFLAFAAMMIGRSGESIGATEKVLSLIPDEAFGTPGMDFLQHWSMRPLLVRIRFARWDELLATPAPPADRLHATAIWHYARGRALAATGDVAGARAELESLRRVAARPELAELRMEFNRSTDLVAIAERVLTGMTEAASRRYGTAVEALAEAVRLEDALTYGEPPEWTVPVRLELGAVLLEAGRHADAERVFRESLEQFPQNGWGLHGLATALRAQGRDREAAQVEAELGEVWATADVAPSA
ncbi:MAG TPA: tetratricopeptide repeat protein [Longimicrobiales bacterium]|nr:tetratricopeptide repeat protein [Longimicrobiales bacterium]